MNGLGLSFQARTIGQTGDMTSVYVTSEQMPMTLEFVNQDLEKVAGVVERWLDDRGVVTFKSAAICYVVNFGQLAAVKVGDRLDPPASVKPVVQYDLGPHY
jgi:hypothetical protein